MKTRKALFIIVILAFLLRLGAFLYFASHGNLEAWEYDDIAKNLASGGGFKNTYLNTTYYSCTPPLYPFLCAAIYKLFGINQKIVILSQIIISAFTCVIIFDLGRRISNPAVGLVSSMLYAVHPGLIVYSTLKLHPLVLDTLLLASTLWAFMYLGKALTSGHSLLAGIIGGLCILTRGTVVAFFAFGLVWLFACFGKHNPKRFFMNVLFIMLALLVVVSPWTIRNFLIHKKIILTTSADAEVFWRGNNINATGTAHTLSGGAILMEDEIFYKKVISMSEIEQRDLFGKEALRFIKENPGKFIELFLKKFYYFWWFSPSAGLLYPSGYLLIYKYLYAVFVFLAAAGIYNLLKRKIAADFKNFILLILFLLSISAFQSLFYVGGRHRWGLEPLFLIISAIGIVSFFQNTRNAACLRTRT